MKKSDKKFSVKGLLVSASLCLTLGGIFWGANITSQNAKALTSYESLFSSESVSYAFVAAPESIQDFDNRSGLKVTGKTNGSALRFAEVASGTFEMEFRALSAQRSISDLESLRLVFTDINTADSFAVEIGLTEDGMSSQSGYSTTEVRAVVDAGHGVGYALDRYTNEFTVYGNVLQSSYCNINSNSIRVEFDPSTMCVYAYEANASERYLLAELDNEKHLQALGAEHFFSDFAEYSVEIEFTRLADKAKTAELMIYSIFGNTISDRYLVETTGPKVYVNTNRKVALNESYDTLNSVKVYDVLEGAIDFNGEVECISPSGNKVELQNYTFQPQETGFYILNFKAKNSKGAIGDVQTAILEAVNYKESVSHQLSFEIQDTAIGLGTTMVFPAMSVYSNFNGMVEYPANLTVKKGTETYLLKTRLWDDLPFVFEETGVFEILYSTDLGNGKTHGVSYTIEVKDDKPTFNGERLKNTYSINSTITLPRKFARLNGEEYLATPTVYYPDGRVVASENVFADVEGEYKTVYKVVINGLEYTHTEIFTIQRTPSSLWESKGGVSFEDNVTLPTYADVYGEGVLLQADRTGATAKYKNILDVSAADMKTPIIEGMFTPEKYGKKELTSLEIRLIDTNDEDNFISIIMSEVQWGYGFRTTVLCKANLGYDAFGMNASGVIGRTEIYSSMQGKYVGTNGNKPSRPFALYFDVKTKSIYAGPNSIEDPSLSLVANLADINQVGMGNEWNGFFDNNVYLEVRFGGLQAAKGNVTILSVLGQSMEGTNIQDETAPFVSLENGIEENMPVAVVGKPYKIPEGILYDAIDGYLGYVKNITVYSLSNGIKNRVMVSNATFTPTNATSYYIEYFGVDKSGNAIIKTLDVQALTATNPLSYELNKDLDEEYFVGEFIRLPDGKATGGSGFINVEKKIVCGDVVYNDFSTTFQPLYTGNYTYMVTLTDYLGQVEVFEYAFSVSLSDSPLVELLNPPTAILLNKPYRFLDAKIVEYREGDGVELPVTIEVNGVVLGENKIYTPTTTDTLQVRYYTTNWEYTCEVKVVDVNANSNYLGNYFLYDDTELTVESKEDYLAFSSNNEMAKDGKVEFSFINSLGLETAQVELKVLKSNFKYFNIYFIDQNDDQISLKFSIEKDSANSSKPIFVLNDTIRKEMSGSFSASSSRTLLAVALKGRYVYDYQGTVLSYIATDLNGNEFEGFPSGKVKVSFEIGGITGESSIGLNKLWNQTLGMIDGDYIPPIVSMGAIEEGITIGSEVALPEIVYFDVLDPSVKTYLTVSCGKETLLDVATGKELYQLLMDDGAQYSFKIESFGKYTIRINIIDSTGNEFEYLKSISVDGAVKPNLTLNGKFNSSCNINEVLMVPGATALDYNNKTLRVFIYFVDSSGRYHDLTAKTYAPTEKGWFTVVYYCYDEFGNYARVTYDIEVK